MPTFRPINPMLIAASPAPARSRTAQVRSLACSSPPSPRTAGPRWRSRGSSSPIDFDVDASREAEAHQGVDRLRARVQDVDEPLVGADLELLPAVLVDERRPDHGELLDARRQRNGSDDVSARALRRLAALGRRLAAP